MLTVERINELLRYDPATGDLYWKVTKSATAPAGSKAGSTNAHGHINLQIDKVLYGAHQIVFILHHGYIPDEIDHVNKIKTDNRVENLRECTSSQNKGNIGLLSNNKSGYKGVSFNTMRQKYHAQIKIHGRQTYLGGFDSPIEAARAYNKAALKHFGEFAWLNPV